MSKNMSLQIAALVQALICFSCVGDYGGWTSSLPADSFKTVATSN